MPITNEEFQFRFASYVIHSVTSQTFLFYQSFICIVRNFPTILLLEDPKEAPGTRPRFSLLPTARKGNVFTRVCDSVHNRPRGYSVTGHPRWLLGHSLLQHSRYASYWNAFLFSFSCSFWDKCGQIIMCWHPSLSGPPHPIWEILDPPHHFRKTTGTYVPYIVRVPGIRDEFRIMLL